MYIADAYNNRVRKVTVSTGIITTIAGNGGVGYSGDNGPATSAAFHYPTNIVVDASGMIIRVFCDHCCLICSCYLGNVYISDQSNSCIRKVSTTTLYPRYSVYVIGGVA